MAAAAAAIAVVKPCLCPACQNSGNILKFNSEEKLQIVDFEYGKG